MIRSLLGGCCAEVNKNRLGAAPKSAYLPRLSTENPCALSETMATSQPIIGVGIRPPSPVPVLARNPPAGPLATAGACRPVSARAGVPAILRRSPAPALARASSLCTLYGCHHRPVNGYAP